MMDDGRWKMVLSGFRVQEMQLLSIVKQDPTGFIPVVNEIGGHMGGIHPFLGSQSLGITSGNHMECRLAARGQAGGSVKSRTGP